MKKVFVALSGGVDSSVAAALLKQCGFDVTGVFMKNWTRSIDASGRVYCPWEEDLAAARAAAAHLGIPLKIYNFEREYHDQVVKYFFREYSSGRTPNPDVMCNREIKFGAFLKRALSEGADYIATGHYARLARKFEAPNPKHKTNYKSQIQNSQRFGFRNSNFDIPALLRGVDPTKDQSYFLWAIKPEVLKYCLFPIGDYHKTQVRQMAREFSLPNADRKDSQGICFIGPISVQNFLREELPVSPGVLRSASGEVLGSHTGSHFLTIGQRHGVGAATGQPVYVAEKDPATNTVWVDEDWPGSRLYSNSAVISHVNWFDPASRHELTSQPADQQTRIPVSVQVRYRQKPVKATITKFQARSTKSETNHKSQIQNSKRFEFRNSNFGFLVRFNEPVRAVTEGQSLVCYNGDRLLGGGVIVSRLRVGID